MKKILTMCLAAALMLLSFSSCDNVKPEFKFQLALSGDVEAPAVVNGDFTVNVTNVFEAEYQCNGNYFAVSEAQDLSSPQGAAANDWLDEYLEQNVVKYFDANATYDIYVKGYVLEKLTGITFSVDKHITNKSN